VTMPNQTLWPTALPEGVWFDFFSDTPYQGGQTVDYPLSEDNFPVWVKAGSFIPMAKGLSRTEQFNARKLEIHYWYDSSVTSSSYTYYEDDGVDPASVYKGLYTTLQLHSSVNDNNGLTLSLSSDGSYIGMPKQRNINYVVHGFKEKPKSVAIDGRVVPVHWDEKGKTLSLAFSCDYQQPVKVVIM